VPVATPSLQGSTEFERSLAMQDLTQSGQNKGIVLGASGDLRHTSAHDRLIKPANVRNLDIQDVRRTETLEGDEELLHKLMPYPTRVPDCIACQALEYHGQDVAVIDAPHLHQSPERGATRDDSLISNTRFIHNSVNVRPLGFGVLPGSCS
jgi:hypothetical protein